LVIGSAVATDAPSRETGQHEVTRDHEVDDDIERAFRDDPIERDGLRDGPRKAVEDISADSGVVVVQAIRDKPDHDVIANEATCIDNRLGHESKFGSLAHSCSQHVTGGNMRNNEVSGQANALRTLSRPLATQQHNTCTRNHYLLCLPIRANHHP
jgi:hypothetical protein